MSDLAVIFVALATGVGAMLPMAVPAVVTLLLLGSAYLLRSALLLCVGCLCAAASLSAHAWASLDVPLPTSVVGTAVLEGDPAYAFGAMRVDATVDNRRFDLWARGRAGDVLRDTSAGQSVRVEGEVQALSGRAAPFLRRRHIAGRINASSIEQGGKGHVVDRTANEVRASLARGAASLPFDQQALLSGLVFGDDRDQSREDIDEFRNAGLSHLLAVSGQNVAFVLLVAAPMLSRLSMRTRLFTGLALLGFFGVLTRWEPSVVRAEGMACVVMVSTYLGRPVSLWRCLALAVTTSILIDPFLAGSVGFLLSASACVGMAAFGSRLTDLMPGPPWLRRSLGYSMAAQLGVAPVQIAVFGGMPLVGLPANVLAEPAAGAVMIWGSSAGLLAGLAGEPLATLISVPSRVLISWLQLVAGTFSALHLGNWRPIHLAVAVALGGWYALWRVRSERRRTTLASCPPSTPSTSSKATTLP